MRRYQVKKKNQYAERQAGLENGQAVQRTQNSSRMKTPTNGKKEYFKQMENSANNTMYEWTHHSEWKEANILP